MSSAKRNTTIIDAYAAILGNLNAHDRAAIMSRLSQTGMNTSRRNKTTFRKAFGAFVSEKSAEEIIEDIRSSRNSNRQTEPL